MKVGDLDLNCYVLIDGRRVFHTPRSGFRLWGQEKDPAALRGTPGLRDRRAEPLAPKNLSEPNRIGHLDLVSHS